MSYENLLVNKNAVFCKRVHFTPEKLKRSGLWLPFREAVEPPLFVPVFRGRLFGDKNSDFFTHLENLKKLRKHHPRLVTIVEVDFILGSHFHTIKSNL